MKMMKQDQTAVLMPRGAAPWTRNPSVTVPRRAVRSLAAWAVIVHCLTLARAAEVLAAREPVSEPTQVRQPAYVPQGRQMERYKAFVRQAELPLITVTNNTLLEVRGAVKLDVTRLAQFTSQKQAALAGQFGVPAGVIGKLVQRVASGPPPSAGQLVQELRTVVIDYRFLQREWERYTPPAEGQTAKRDALAALQAGDITKAWELYDGLRRPPAPAIGAPAPPTNLRVVAQP